MGVFVFQRIQSHEEHLRIPPSAGSGAQGEGAGVTDVSGVSWRGSGTVGAAWTGAGGAVLLPR